MLGMSVKASVTMVNATLTREKFFDFKKLKMAALSASRKFGWFLGLVKFF